MAERALTALLTERDIVEAMEARNYDTKKVGEGRALMEAAKATIDVQSGREGDRSLATGTRAGRMRLALWRALSGTARAVFRDDAEALRVLGLTGNSAGRMR